MSQTSVFLPAQWSDGRTQEERHSAAACPRAFRLLGPVGKAQRVPAWACACPWWC